MQKYLLYTFIFLLLLIAFFVSANSITSAKLIELRLNIQKDQIMNYELSSQALKSKLRQIFLEKDNFENEIKINILESTILNSNIQESKLELSTSEKAGLLLVNVVRIISFKPPIDLSSSQRNTILLQYAFYQERTRRYKIASEKYFELEDILPSDTDEYAFVLLHNGFCLAMLGLNSEAYFQLDKVYNLFPGTHYSENANLLIDFLKESESKKISMQSMKNNPNLFTKSLYLNGDYEDVLKELEKLPILSKDLSFIKARSLEELGRTEFAIKEYIPLSQQSTDRGIAIKANRRLMLLSNYYAENKELANISEKNAIKLRDTKALKTVEESKEFKQEAKVIAIIQSNEFKESSLVNLKEEISQDFDLHKDKKLSSNLLIINKEPNTISVAGNNPPSKIKENHKEVMEDYIPKTFEVILSDGRILSGSEIEFDKTNQNASIKTENFPIKTPTGNIDTIRILVPKDKTINNPIKIKLINGSIRSGNLIIFNINKIKIEYLESTQEKNYNELDLKEVKLIHF